jgi:hypothetical protein
MAEITQELASTNFDIPHTLINAIGQSIADKPTGLESVGEPGAGLGQMDVGRS